MKTMATTKYSQLLRDAAGYPKILTPKEAEHLREQMREFLELPPGRIIGVPALLNR
jgi:hypothetical protein